MLHSRSLLLPKTFGRSVSVSAFTQLCPPRGRKLIRDILLIVWKHMKDLIYLGSFHTGDLPEFFGLTGDHVGTDALGMHASISFLLRDPGR